MSRAVLFRFWQPPNNFNYRFCHAHFAAGGKKSGAKTGKRTRSTFRKRVRARLEGKRKNCWRMIPYGSLLPYAIKKIESRGPKISATKVGKLIGKTVRVTFSNHTGIGDLSPRTYVLVLYIFRRSSANGFADGDATFAMTPSFYHLILRYFHILARMTTPLLTYAIVCSVYSYSLMAFFSLPSEETSDIFSVSSSGGRNDEPRMRKRTRSQFRMPKEM